MSYVQSLKATFSSSIRSIFAAWYKIFRRKLQQNFRSQTEASWTELPLIRYEHTPRKQKNLKIYKEKHKRNMWQSCSKHSLQFFWSKCFKNLNIFSIIILKWSWVITETITLSSYNANTSKKCKLQCRALCGPDIWSTCLHSVNTKGVSAQNPSLCFRILLFCSH